MKKKVLVLSGGGAHTTTYLGVWQFIYEKIQEDERYIPDYIIGTSGGALFGCLMAARKDGEPFSGEEIRKELIRQRPWELFKITPIKWAANMIFSWGLVDIEKIRGRIRKILEKYGIDWQSFTKPRYRCIVTDLSEGRRKYIPIDMAMELDAAIAASIAIPGVFKPIWYGKKERHCYVDGGVCEGFPVKAALEIGRRKVKIMAVSPFNASHCYSINTLLDYFSSLFHTLLHCKQKDMEYLLNEKYGDFHLITGSYAKGLMDFSKATINKNFKRGLQVAMEYEEKIDEFFTGK